MVEACCATCAVVRCWLFVVCRVLIVVGCALFVLC